MNYIDMKFVSIKVVLIGP